MLHQVVYPHIAAGRVELAGPRGSVMSLTMMSIQFDQLPDVRRLVRVSLWQRSETGSNGRGSSAGKGREYPRAVGFFGPAVIGKAGRAELRRRVDGEDFGIAMYSLISIQREPRFVPQAFCPQSCSGIHVSTWDKCIVNNMGRGDEDAA